MNNNYSKLVQHCTINIKFNDMSLKVKMSCQTRSFSGQQAVQEKQAVIQDSR